MGAHADWPEISLWINKSRQLFLKKLSRNDCSWADDSGKHQAGFYIPEPIQKSGFFPDVQNSNLNKPHILDTHFETFWPASGETKTSALKHYTNKGSEFHCTRIPRDEFSNLSPASLLIGGKLETPIGNAFYWFATVDSSSPEAEILEATFSLQSDFHSGIFSPDALFTKIGEEEQLIVELAAAIRDGTLDRYIAAQSLPNPMDLAQQAQQTWLREEQMPSLDPYLLPFPGDAVMRISRDIEFSLYRQSELRQRAAQVAGLLLRGEDPITSLVRNFRSLDKLFLSASQTRKSRAGLSFEHHVKRLLVDGRVRHEAQAVFAGRRPDFVLPNVKALNEKADAVIVSLKTTLRERWKQLALEKQHGTIFLATVDDRISTEAINDMQRNHIGLIVPESLKRKGKQAEAVYSEHSNVISFRQFFDDEIRANRPSLILPL